MATVGYLLAYALFLDWASWRDRFLTLAPNAAVLLTWALVYRYLAFGTHGSGFYIDPLGNPLAFASSVFGHSPLLLLGQWSPIPADVAMLVSQELFHVLWLVSLGLIVLLVFLFFPLLRKDRVARFWCLGMLLSLLPIAATSPSNRLLFFVGLGAMGLLAQLLSGLVGEGEGLPLSRGWRIPACILGVILVVV
ncbi:MAG: hypothetical protein ACE5JU_23555, partial [Candidatus Binatia bacterium]